MVREDLYNRHFVFDIYVLITKNLNPFSLEQRVADQNKHEMLYMLWKEYIPVQFYNFICQEENFLYLNGKNVLHPKTADMVWSFISQDENNYNLPINNLCKFKNIFQYVYSIVYPDIYCSTERRGFDFKSSVQLTFKACKDKKKAELGKDPSNYKDKNEHFKFEQKSIEIDSFNEIEEEKMREKIERRKQKRHELVERNKALRKKT